MKVYDIQTDTIIEVSQAEAAAGLARYARTLGAGTAACGVYEQKAIELAETAGAR